VAAKLMILTKPSATPPMGQYYIEQRRTDSAATPFSSLAPSNRSAPADAQAVDVYATNNAASEAPPCETLRQHTVPGILDGTPGSKTDSEATVPMCSFEQWEEYNRIHGLGFDSSKSWDPKTGFIIPPKMEEDAGDKQEV